MHSRERAGRRGESVGSWEWKEATAELPDPSMPAPRDARSFPHREIGVTAREDFVGRMPDGTLIHSNRETGRDDDDYETEPRMAAYVLWAVEYYRMSVDAISTELVFLKTGATKTSGSLRSSYGRCLR